MAAKNIIKTIRPYSRDCVCMCLQSLQSRLILCDPMDCSLPGSPVHGFLQAKILEWVAVPSSRGSSHPGIEPMSPGSPALQPNSLLLSHGESPTHSSGNPYGDSASGCVYVFQFILVQFSSVAQSCPTLCNPMNRSTPGLPVHHHLPEFTQTHTHQVSDVIQPSHPLLSPSPPAPNPSQHRSLFQ